MEGKERGRNGERKGDERNGKERRRKEWWIGKERKGDYPGNTPGAFSGSG